MKQNLLKIGAALVCILLVLGMTGGVLAQPEGAGSDRFVGFHLVYGTRYPAVDMSDPNWEESLDDIPPLDRSQWVEYGTESVQLEGIGSVKLAREILIGQYDEAEGRYVFPGMDGINCFLVERTNEYGETSYAGYSGLANVHVNLGEDEISVSGTVYFGRETEEMRTALGKDEYIWTAYRVYQKPDGTVYMTDSGNSFGGMGGITVSERREYTSTVGGRQTVQALEAEFSVEYVERVSDVTVKWFDEQDQVLGERDLSPEEIGDGLSLYAPWGTRWALVLVTDERGTVSRDAYSLEEEGGSQRLVLLDDRGLGRVVYVNLHPYEEERV